MAKVISEINRVREIMGLRLLTESVGGGFAELLAKAFGKSEDDALDFLRNSTDEAADAFRKEVDDIATGLGKTTNDILDEIASGTIADDVADKLGAKLLNSANKELKESIINGFISKYPGLKELNTVISDTAKIDAIVASGNKEVIDGLMGIGKRIEGMGLGDETTKHFTSKLDDAIKAAESKVTSKMDELADIERIAKQLADDEEAAAKLSRQVEELQNKKVSDLIEILDNDFKRSGLPTSGPDYDSARKILDAFIEKNGNMPLISLVKPAQAEYKSFIKAAKNAADAAAKGDKEAWEKFTKKWFTGPLGQFWKSITQKGAISKYGKGIIVLALIGATTYGGVKLYTGSELEPEKLSLLKQRIIGSFGGDCITEDEITVNFVDAKFQSEGDVYSPSEYTGKAVIVVPINGEDKTLEFNESLKKFVLYGDTTPVTCKGTPGLGVTADDLAATGGGTPTPAPAPAPQQDEMKEFEAYVKQLWGAASQPTDTYYKQGDEFIASDGLKIFRFVKDGNSFKQIN